MAIHFALRAATIRLENATFIEYAPLVVAVLFGIFAGMRGMPYAQIYAGTFAVSLLSGMAWAFEKITKTSAIDFMRYDIAFINYGSDPQLNFIFVAIGTCLWTAIGGTLGAAIRFLLSDRLSDVIT